MTALYDGYGNLILAKTPPQPDLALVADMLREPERFTEGAREEQALLCEQADNAEAARIGTVKRSAVSGDGLPRDALRAIRALTEHEWITTDGGSLLAAEDIAATIRRLASSGQVRELEEDADAVRYRWLRSDPPSTLAVRADRWHGQNNVYLDGENLDTAIDTAMQASREGR